MTATRRTARVEVSGDVIAYDDITGDDTTASSAERTAVLVHGSGGNRATWWPVLPRLVNAGWRVVNVDVRGSGRSTDTAKQLGPRQVSADLEAIRLDAGVESWHVIGHSMGGWHALRYAVEHPDATSAVSCLSSIGGVMTPAAVEWFAEFARMAATWSAANDPFHSASLRDAWCVDHQAEAYLYQLLRELNPDPVRGVPGEDMASNALSTDEVAVLASLDCRFVTGEHDPYAPPTVVRSCAEAVRAQFTEVPGAGHTFFWEAPGTLEL
jgi:pimeloyl-ACP methyl ester carboxylesterase